MYKSKFLIECITVSQASHHRIGGLPSMSFIFYLCHNYKFLKILEVFLPCLGKQLHKNYYLCFIIGETFVTRKITRAVAKISLGLQEEVTY